jgi:hypothetical protein
MPNFLATFRSHTNGRPGQNKTLSPRGDRGEIRAWFRQDSPEGMYTSTAHTVAVEQDAHPRYNRLVTHVSLVDESGKGTTYSSVLVVRSHRFAPTPEEASGFTPGTFIGTPEGRQIPLAEALQALDSYCDQRDRQRALARAQKEEPTESPR